MCCINPRTLSAGARHCRSIMSCPLGAQQQTRRMLQRLSNDGTMNGLTDARPLRRPCSAYYEVCFINPRNIRAEASGVVNKRACTTYCVSLHTVAACLRKQLISHVPLWLAPPFTTAHLNTPEHTWDALCRWRRLKEAPTTISVDQPFRYFFFGSVR